MLDGVVMFHFLTTVMADKLPFTLTVGMEDFSVFELVVTIPDVQPLIAMYQCIRYCGGCQV
jgi:hypothetical protein